MIGCSDHVYDMVEELKDSTDVTVLVIDSSDLWETLSVREVVTSNLSLLIWANWTNGA